MRISDWSSDVCSSDLDRIIIGSMMAPIDEQAWKELAIRIANAGVHGIELNLGCPHGMCERGMGSAIGQVPEFVERNTRWVREAVNIPVVNKLTPNITDIWEPPEPAQIGKPSQQKRVGP